MLIAMVSGMPDPVRSMEAICGRTAAPWQTAEVLRLCGDQAMGCLPGPCPTARRPSDHEMADPITVLVDGEIFDHQGPVARPEAFIAALYREAKLDRLAELNGSFAVIIHDAARGTVTLASDRLGTRPLYYWHGGGRNFAAASAIGALLADDRVPRRASRQALVELLSYFRTFGAQTQYADIHALEGAEVVVFTSGGPVRRRTRRLRWSRPNFNESEGAQRLAQALRGAARRRLADAERPMLLLSGGLDSRIVLAAATAEGKRIACVTYAAYDNPECAIARRCAAVAGQPFEYVDVSPHSLPAHIDAATATSDGLYIAPINFFGALGDIAREHDAVLSGHGLDYTIRAMYLPRRMLHIAGSRTVLARLRETPDAAPERLAAEQYVASDVAALQILAPTGAWSTWHDRRIVAMERVLAHADVDDPHDAWDAYILHNQVRHYANSDFVAVNRVAQHRPLAFDSEVLDIYFRMPAAWRASGRMARQAAMILSPTLMDIPNANTGVAARRPFALQVAFVLARAALRRLGLAARPKVPDPTMTTGSWANVGELMRRDAGLRSRIEALGQATLFAESGLFARGGIERLVAEHMNRRANHTKPILQLITIASWFEQFGYTAIAD